MAAWTADTSALQLPVDMVIDYSLVNRLSIYSNAPSLTNYTGTSHYTGDLEFWCVDIFRHDVCVGAAPSQSLRAACWPARSASRANSAVLPGLFERLHAATNTFGPPCISWRPSRSSCYGSVGNTHGSDSTAGTADCYGSFQVHAEDGTCIFAYVSRHSWVSLSSLVLPARVSTCRTCPVCAAKSRLTSRAPSPPFRSVRARDHWPLASTITPVVFFLSLACQIHSCRYNGWSNTAVDDLGIGNYAGSVHTDWTFAANAATYSTKFLTVFVQAKPPVE